jgi:hypothetical protein
LVEWSAGETEVLWENLPQCYFVHHSSHMTWPGAKPARHGWNPATIRLSYYDTAMNSAWNSFWPCEICLAEVAGAVGYNFYEKAYLIIT